MKLIRPLIEYIGDYDSELDLNVENLAVRNMLEDMKNNQNEIKELVESKGTNYIIGRKASKEDIRREDL